jgi:hypothetical protein
MLEPFREGADFTFFVAGGAAPIASPNSSSASIWRVQNHLKLLLIPPQLDLRSPQRAAENPFFGGIMAANEQVWTPEQK